MLQFDGGQAQTTDAYPPWPSNLHPNTGAPTQPVAAILGPSQQGTGVLFSTYNNLVDVQIAFRDRNTPGWGLEYMEIQGLSPGAFVFPGKIGFRMKSHNPGGVVQVIGQVWETIDGPLPSTPLSANTITLSSGGTIIPPTIPLNVQYNNVLVASQATLDFVDTPGIAWGITNDGANSRVKVQAGMDLSKRPLSAVQSIPNGVTTALVLGAGFTTNSSVFSNPVSNSRTTVAVSGYYEWTGTATFAAVVGGTVRIIQLYVNGSPFAYLLSNAIMQVPPVGGNPTSVLAQFITFHAANDFVEIFVVQDSGGALNVTNACLEGKLLHF